MNAARRARHGRYDVYEDLAATHGEIGYLLTILVLLAAFDGALGAAWLAWPLEDVYLVPGISACTQVTERWGAAMPPALAAGGASAGATAPAPALTPLALPALLPAQALPVAPP
jgi:hypothetical protein